MRDAQTLIWQMAGMKMAVEKHDWMIEAGDVVDVMVPHRKQPAATEFDRPGEAVARAATMRRGRPRRRRIRPARSGLRFAPLVALTYALGPLSILLTPAGRAQKICVFWAGLSYVAMVVLVAFRFGQLVRPAEPASVWVWLALLGVAVVGGFVAWSRAVSLLADEGLPQRYKLPHWLRRDWVVSLLGLFAPGSGFLLGGRADRAAAVLWSLCPAVLAAAVLLNAGDLWRYHRQQGWLADGGPQLEKLFLIAGAAVGLGFLAYIAQALEGVRQMVVEPGLWRQGRRDYYAFGLVAVLALVAVAANPERMAAQLQAGGEVLRAEGLQVIPLKLAVTAHHLDPGEPEYSLRAMELYAELGHEKRANNVRSELDRYYGALYRARADTVAAATVP